MSGIDKRALKELLQDLAAPQERLVEGLDAACAACTGDAAPGHKANQMLEPDRPEEAAPGLGPKADELLQSLNPLHGAPPPSGSQPGRDATGSVGTVRHPPRVGRYRVLRLIGEGGMGSVYEAEQDKPRRRVALKVIRSGMDSRQVVARFEVEREALALMDHPNIARVLDAGVTDADRPFFAMELVKGVPITEYCDQAVLTVRQRLALIVQVCGAVQHAHQNGIIHRDLKPSNVLVSQSDGATTPKVIDFGIAAVVQNPRLWRRTRGNPIRGFAGTPEYMSPEQTWGDEPDVDARADVYGLGVIVYELLTGGTPFDLKGLRSTRHRKVARIIREVVPQSPSCRLAHLAPDALRQVAARRGATPKELRGAVGGDLDLIAMKCLEKERARRYAGPHALAGDINRYLAGETVAARLTAAIDRLSRGDADGCRSVAREFFGKFARGARSDPAARTVGILAQDRRARAGVISALAVAARALDLAGSSHGSDVRSFELTRALRECRAGRPEAALEWLERSRSNERPRTGSAGTYRDAAALCVAAMAHHGLAHRESARAELLQAERLINGAVGPGEPDLAAAENLALCQALLLEARQIVGSDLRRCP